MNNHEFDKRFKDAVAQKNIPFLRAYISEKIGNDPLFEQNECEECMRYISEAGLDITEPYVLNASEQETPTDTAAWTKELFFRKVSFLRRNFAYEKRASDLRKIGSIAFADNCEKQKTNFSEAPQGRRSEKKKSPLSQLIAIVAVAVALIGLVILLFRR